MFNSNDEQYLIRAIGQNRVVLFLGAGFSADTQSRMGRNMPVGNDLGRLFWTWLKYDGGYDGTSLSDMYQAVLDSGRKEDEIVGLLEGHLLCDTFPEQYRWLSRFFWYRIYTTNVDNLVENIYKAGGDPKLEAVAFPSGEPRERDQSLSRIQMVYLHGRLPCRPNQITFSVRQYASRANLHDPLYDQFVRDYATHPTIFIGTQLNEPLFWQYIEARSDRPSGVSEQRQKSFLIAPAISPAKRAPLERVNVIPVQADTHEFLSWLQSIAPKVPSRIEILRSFAPDLAQVYEDTSLHGSVKKSREAFAKSFHRVPIESTATSNARSLYLLGATPQWDDLLSDLDAPRQVETKIENKICHALDARKQAELFAILGSAGCGKSTILRRVGLNMARSGRTVYLTNSEELPKPQHIANALESFTERAVLLFDNAEVALALIPDLIEKVKNIEKPPVLAIACRTNDYDRRASRFSTRVHIHDFSVPNLTRPEIVQLVSKLDRAQLLGRLAGMSHAERLKEFEERSSKQILVAMREATSGRGFDEILEDEFDKLVPHEAKILYLCVALATEAGYRITREEFVGCAEVTPAEALHILERNLRDIVVSSGSRNEMLMLRHKRIAECALENFAPRHLLTKAYIRLLGVLSSEIAGLNWRSRTFSFYRDIVNHRTIYKRFEEDIEDARLIYESIASRFKTDAQFWLQYGSLELEAGSLAYAENYLNQADSLDRNNPYIENAKGHLLLKKAVAAATKAQAVALRDTGSQLLKENMERHRISDPYTYHIYCSQRLKWMHTWVDEREARVQELEHLRETISRGMRDYRGTRELSALQEAIESEYLSQAIPGGC